MSISARSVPVQIRAGAALIEGDLAVPDAARGLVVFAHGSGSSRFSRRNRAVAGVLQDGGFATLLLDLLTRDEDAVDQRTREYRFDIERLGHRVVVAVDWAAGVPALSGLPIACFGASTGAAAALIAAAERADVVRAVISRGGRPDLAGEALARVQAPTLLIVGEEDREVITLNRAAMRQMHAPVQIAIVPGATHLFEEPGALELASRLALDWCQRQLQPRAARVQALPITLSLPEAVAAVLVAAISADGTFDVSEANRLNSLLSTSPLFDEAVQAGDVDVVERALRLLTDHGVAPVLAACAAGIPLELRATVFAVAADLVLSDGRIEGHEKAFLDQLQGALKVDDDTALKIVEVLLIKNRRRARTDAPDAMRGAADVIPGRASR